MKFPLPIRATSLASAICFLMVAGSVLLQETDAVGTSVTRPVSVTGAIDFKFEGDTGNFVINDGVWAPSTSIALIGTDHTVNGKSSAFILRYNDSAGAVTLGDWVDFAVGVNFIPAIPEPVSYALMLAGLGPVGGISRRRIRNKASDYHWPEQKPVIPQIFSSGISWQQSIGAPSTL